MRERLAGLLGILDSLPKPTLARVNGDGYGGAIGLLGACDIAVAASHAKFAFSEVRLGIIPAVISPFVLAKIGEAAARRYFLTAETLTAERLRELSLVHEVVPAAELERSCERICASLLQAAPGALAEAKRLIRDVARSGEDTRGRLRRNGEAARALARAARSAGGLQGVFREAQTGVGVPALTMPNPLTSLSWRRPWPINMGDPHSVKRHWCENPLTG